MCADRPREKSAIAEFCADDPVLRKANGCERIEGGSPRKAQTGQKRTVFWNPSPDRSSSGCEALFFASLVPGLRQVWRHSRTAVVLGLETLRKRRYNLTHPSPTAARPLTKGPEGEVADQLLPDVLWHAIQHSAHVRRMRTARNNPPTLPSYKRLSKVRARLCSSYHGTVGGLLRLV